MKKHKIKVVYTKNGKEKDIRELTITEFVNWLKFYFNIAKVSRIFRPHTNITRVEIYEEGTRLESSYNLKILFINSDGEQKHIILIDGNGIPSSSFYIEYSGFDGWCPRPIPADVNISLDDIF